MSIRVPAAHQSTAAARPAASPMAQKSCSVHQPESWELKSCGWYMRVRWKAISIITINSSHVNRPSRFLWAHRTLFPRTAGQMIGKTQHMLIKKAVSYVVHANICKQNFHTMREMTLNRECMPRTREMCHCLQSSDAEQITGQRLDLLPLLLRSVGLHVHVQRAQQGWVSRTARGTHVSRTHRTARWQGSRVHVVDGSCIRRISLSTKKSRPCLVSLLNSSSMQRRMLEF